MDKESSEDDVWDDTILIKAYDNSVKLAREELAKRIAQSTNKIADKGTDKNLQPSNSKKNEKMFKVGDYVRSTYDDGVDYEAKIIAIEGGICSIKYIGYDNEEDVEVCNLIPSWGKNSRRIQFSKAKQHTSQITKNTDKSNRMRYSPHQIPPPPPMPPMLNDLNEDSEDISAMLMAWYMSGYYTGLYQGQKMAKSRSKNKTQD